jgi:exoribonuclease R
MAMLGEEFCVIVSFLSPEELKDKKTTTRIYKLTNDSPSFLFNYYLCAFPLDFKKEPVILQICREDFYVNSQFVAVFNFPKFTIVNHLPDVHPLTDETALFDYFQISALNSGVNQFLTFMNWQRQSESFLRTIDMTEDPTTFTMDPEQSVDLDDAISYDPDTRTVWVHVTDFSEQVLSEPAIFHQVMTRGETLYLHNQTLNLLPDDWVNAFSLDEGQERSTISVCMRFNEDYTKLVEHEILKANIVVKNRLSYRDLLPPNAEMLYRITENFRNPNKPFQKNIPIVDQHGLVVGFERTSSDDQEHVMISTLMTCANYLIGRTLSLVNKSVTISRTYDGDSKQPTLTSVMNSSSASFSSEVGQHSQLSFIGEKVGSNQYTPATSPIRRATDILAHLILQGYTCDPFYYEQVVEHLDRRSKLAKAIQTYVNQRKVTRFIHSHEKKTLYGTVAKMLPDDACTVYLPEVGVHYKVGVHKFPKEISLKVQQKFLFKFEQKWTVHEPNIVSISVSKLSPLASDYFQQ